MENYQDEYESLPGPEYIRILTIHASQSFSDPICCTMGVAKAEKESQYTALSYSWGMNLDGDDSLSRRIIINGKELPVTQNLYEGLLRIRAKYGSQRMWVDAVCINQKDDLERTVQVQNMANVFSNSSQLIIWLGEGRSDAEDQDVDSILACVEYHTRSRSSSTTTANEAKKIWNFCDGSTPNISEIVESMQLTPYNEERKVPLDEDKFDLAYSILIPLVDAFYSRRYFTRRWVVQEIFHADIENTTVLWGPCSRSMTSIKYVTKDTYFRSHYRNYYLFKPKPWHEAWRSMELKVQKATRVLSRLTHIWGGIFSVFCLYEGLKCRDPRDVLYSLLSLEPEDCRRYNLVVDYKITTAQLYARYTSILLEEHRLNLLLECLAHSRAPTWPLPKVPSWVPDFASFHGINPGFTSETWLESNGVLICKLYRIETKHDHYLDAPTINNQYEVRDRIAGRRTALRMKPGDVLFTTTRCLLGSLRYFMVLRPLHDNPTLFKLVWVRERRDAPSELAKLVPRTSTSVEVRIV